jgi:hypothetical protein
VEAALQEFERLVRDGIPTTKPTEIKDSRLDASEQTGAEAQPSGRKRESRIPRGKGLPPEFAAQRAGVFGVTGVLANTLRGVEG